MVSKYDNSNIDTPLVFEGTEAYSQAYQPLRLIHQSRAGIRRADLMRFGKQIGRTLLELSEILPSSYSTLTKKDLFDKATSEHILQLRAIYAQGVEVFGDITIFNDWLDQPIEAYDDATSFSILDTSFGIELVSEALYKIDLGLPV